jgi:hypothetical protein
MANRPTPTRIRLGGKEDDGGSSSSSNIRGRGVRSRQEKKKSQQNRKISPRESSKRLVNSYAGCALGKWVEAMMSPNPDVCVCRGQSRTEKMGEVVGGMAR